MHAAATAPTADHWIKRHPWLIITAVCAILFIPTDLVLGYARIPANHRLFHPYYHHDLASRASFEETWGKVTYRINTNSLGFKDAEVRDVSLDVPADKTRLLILGDSFGEGIGVPYEKTFPGLLQQRLGTARYEVLNASVASYSPLFYYLKLRYLLETTHLKMQQVLVLIDISDIQDEVEYYGFEPLMETPLSRRTDVFLKGHSFSYATLRPAIKAAFQRVQARLAHGGGASAEAANEPAAAPRDLDVMDFFANRRQERARWTFDDAVFEKWGRRGVQIATRHLEALTALCASHGVKLTLAVYPWPAQIAQRDLDSRQVRIWKEFAAAQRIDFINLFPAFIGAEDPASTIERWFIRGDNHWNEAGHREVADRLAAALGLP